MDLMEIVKSGGAALVVVLTLVQIAPIRLNPWSWIARIIGRAMNADMMEAIEENNATIARYRIIRFNDEILHDVKHTEEHFNQIIEDVDTYNKYCIDHPKFPNGKAIMSVKNVQEVYEKCRQENSFL